jgi:hypothetical protein
LIQDDGAVEFTDERLITGAKLRRHGSFYLCGGVQPTSLLRQRTKHFAPQSNDIPFIDTRFLLREVGVTLLVFTR